MTESITLEAWPEDRVLIDLEELAKLLHLSTETIRPKLQPRGDWPCRRVGRGLRFAREDVAVIVAMTSSQPPVRRRRSA